VPGVGIVGPDAGHNQPAFVATFAQDEAADPDITMLTDHEYPLSDCDGATNTISGLLSTSSNTAEKAAADSAVSGGVLDKVPAVMDETNSITCGGQSGVSNVFASTLWSLDYSLLLAQEGVQGADFHGGISGCGPYSPLCQAAAARSDGAAAVLRLPGGAPGRHRLVPDRGRTPIRRTCAPTRCRTAVA
jgi:hypothetical protein